MMMMMMMMMIVIELTCDVGKKIGAVKRKYNKSDGRRQILFFDIKKIECNKSGDLPKLL